MIKSCEDITTLDEFEYWAAARGKMLRIGLEETAEILCWDSENLMCPELFENLFEKEIFRK